MILIFGGASARVARSALQYDFVRRARLLFRIAGVDSKINGLGQRLQLAR